MGTGYKEYNIPPTLKIPAWTIDYTADELSQAIQAARDALVQANINRNLGSSQIEQDSDKTAGYYVKNVTEEEGSYVDKYTEAGFPPTSEGQGITKYADPEFDNTILALRLSPYATITDADETSNIFYIKVPDPEYPGDAAKARYYPYGSNEFSFLKLNENFIDINSKLYTTIRKARKYLEEISSEDSGKFLLIRSNQEGEPNSVELVYDKATLDMFKAIPDACQHLIGVKTDGSIAPMKLSAEHIADTGLSDMQIISGKQHALIVANITSLLTTLEKPEDIEENYNTASAEWQDYVDAYNQLDAYKQATNLVTYDEADTACAAFVVAQSKLSDVEIKAEVLKALDAFAAMLYAMPNSDAYTNNYSDLGFTYYLAEGNTELTEADRTSSTQHFNTLVSFYNFWSYNVTNPENLIRYTDLPVSPSATDVYQYAFSDDDATSYNNDVNALYNFLTSCLDLELTTNISALLEALSLKDIKTTQDLIDVIYEIIALYEAPTGALGSLRNTYLSQLAN